MKVGPDGDVLRVRDLATLWGLSTQAVYSRVKSGSIPSIKIGHSIRISAQWARQNTKDGVLLDAVLRRNGGGGRPTVEPKPGTRVGVGFRITAELKLRLKAASVASGRSISHETELRLERSFEQDLVLGKLDQILERLPQGEINAA